MTWAELRAQRRVAAEPTGRDEIASLRALATRNLSDASIAGLSVDGRFEHAYAAARALATIVVRASGYRVRQSGARYNTFQALEAADPDVFGVFAIYFDSCRGLRNTLSHDTVGVVSKKDLEELLEQLPRFEETALEWISANHPELA